MRFAIQTIVFFTDFFYSITPKNSCDFDEFSNLNLPRGSKCQPIHIPIHRIILQDTINNSGKYYSNWVKIDAHGVFSVNEILKKRQSQKTPFKVYIAKLQAK